MYSNYDYDRYLTEKQAEYEDRCNKPVETCFECDEDLYENEECYYINGHYYCKDCIRRSAIILEEESYLYE